MIRFFDIFFSLLALIFLIPFFLPLIGILRLTGEGEVFYFQTRIGLNENKFKLFKFATMNKNSSDQEMGNITIKNDPRILPIGKFLRNTKINELPQLLNILIGDMSIIGPRPLVEEGYYSYPKKYLDEMKKIKPGLSGLASIILRNEEEILTKTSCPKEFHSKTLIPYKAKLEIWYEKRSNVKNYFLLILLTIIIIFSPKSAVVDWVFNEIPTPPENLKKILNEL